MKTLYVLFACSFALGTSVAALATPLTTTVDINRANQVKSYSCDLNGYDSSATSASSSFTNCSLVSTFSVTTPADFGNWNAQLTGTAISIIVTGCKQDSFAILGSNAHIEYICPKTP